MRLCARETIYKSGRCLADPALPTGTHQVCPNPLTCGVLSPNWPSVPLYPCPSSPPPSIHLTGEALTSLSRLEAGSGAGLGLWQEDRSTDCPGTWFHSQQRNLSSHQSTALEGYGGLASSSKRMKTSCVVDQTVLGICGLALNRYSRPLQMSPKDISCSAEKTLPPPPKNHM